MAPFTDMARPFTRNADGSWTCVKALLLEAPLVKVWLSPGMVFRRGQSFLGVNVVAKLEEMERSATRRTR